MSTSERRGRLLGVDAVRALAILGMVYEHVNPTGWLHGRPPAQAEPALRWTYDMLQSRSMSLFVLLAGVSVALMTGGPGEAGPFARRRLAVRAAALLLISLVLDQILGVGASILQWYAVWLVLLLPLVRVRARTLFGAAGALALLTPAFSFAVMNYGQDWWLVGRGAPSPNSQSVYGFAQLLHPEQWVDTFLISGGGFQTPYALPLLLAGLAIGRLDLRDHVVRLRMMLAGAGLAIGIWLVSWVGMNLLGAGQALDRYEAAMASPGGMPGGIPGAMPAPPWSSLLALPPRVPYAFSVSAGILMAGVALVLVGGLLIALDQPGRRRALRPLAVFGAMPLTWYTAHLLALEPFGEHPRSLPIFVIFLVFGLVGSVAWRHWVRRGPLEWLVHKTTVFAIPGPRAGGDLDRDRAVPERARSFQGQ